MARRTSASGVLGSLNMVADAFKLLPTERETKRRWSTVEWAKERKGWVFITSKPTMRERMRPLISLWLDLLVLRLMNDDTARRKTWFVLDELASLQHLPQLKTAVTENRKSNNPMVLGFQGKAQVEALYGHVAEAMLSQPATKIFLKTSEPHASEWISKAIGEVEIERFRESRTHGRFPRGTRRASSATSRASRWSWRSRSAGLIRCMAISSTAISSCRCASRTWSWRTMRRSSSSER